MILEYLGAIVVVLALFAVFGLYARACGRL